MIQPEGLNPTTRKPREEHALGTGHPPQRCGGARFFMNARSMQPSPPDLHRARRREKARARRDVEADAARRRRRARLQTCMPTGPGSPRGSTAAHRQARERAGRHAIDKAGSSRHLASAGRAAEDPRGGSPGRLLAALLEACITVPGALAADHAEGVDDPRNVAQCSEHQADAELHAAAEAPEDAEGRQEVGTHQGAQLIAEPVGAHVRTGGG
eukprot:CAMPEP_0175270620 /NCGR_PEP_ID=MMETSP0093-20121207/45477_1 /TAXON_ID=311494 /ORGANISM="Alexandrium monilatum, Strain CCMP3105" /LENGTH=212 /DNA_ID=CAMNT_0016565331 /DNA_START=54 /DNA_END=688 /DNA_ORIENTATION=-